MEEKKTDYRSFLLRIWIEQTDGNKWRFSLEDTQTGKRKSFASVEKLIVYLEDITRYTPNSSEEMNEQKKQSWSKKRAANDFN